MAAIVASGTTIPRTDLQASFMEAPQAQLYIAPQIYPEFQVPDFAGKFGRVTLADQLVRQKVVRTSTGHYPRSQWGLSDDSWETKEYGHEAVIDQRQSAVYANYVDFEQVEANRLREILLREWELRVMALVHNTTTYPLSGNTGLSITNEWDDYTNATPINDVTVGLLAFRARGINPANAVLQISYRAWRDLSQCDQILQRLKYVSKPATPISAEELASALGVAKVIVAGAFYNSADQGLAASIAEIWDAEYAFMFIPARGNDISEPCLGRTMYCTKDGGGSPTSPMVEQYVEDPVRGDVLRVRNEQVEKTLFSSCGFLFGNCKT